VNFQMGKFYLFILLIIFAEVFALRFKAVFSYRNFLLSSKNPFTLTLVKEPVRYKYYQILDVGYFKVKTKNMEDFKPGDILKVLLRGDVYEVSKVSEVWYAGFLHYFSDMRENIKNIFFENFPSPYGELLAGMTLGVKEIPNDFNEALIRVGLIHVVVVSGFNITLVISALFPLFLIFGRKYAFVLSSVGVALFVMIVGFEPPVIRAAIMGLIVLVGKFLGRERDMFAILVLTAFIMLFVNPLLISDLSFILSFLATSGIICGDWILNMVWGRRLLSNAPKFLMDVAETFADDFKSTLTAQLFVWPIISYTFGRISLISILVNVFTLWTVPITTVLGFVYIAVYFVLHSLGLSSLLGFLSFIFLIPLAYFADIVRLFSGFSFSSIDFGVGKMFLVFYYLFLFILCYLGYARSSFRKND